jgi:hypothetical protein
MGQDTWETAGKGHGMDQEGKIALGRTTIQLN